MDAARYVNYTEFGSKLKGEGYATFYPDGSKGGTAIEVKGPGDSQRPDQYAKYADASKDKRCLVISPESCDTEGVCNASGRCK